MFWSTTIFQIQFFVRRIVSQPPTRIGLEMNQQRRISALKNSPYASIVGSIEHWNAVLLNKDNSPNIIPIKFWGISIDTLSGKMNWVPLDKNCNSYYNKSNFVC